jgi:hypothetical protein
MQGRVCGFVRSVLTVCSSTLFQGARFTAIQDLPLSRTRSQGDKVNRDINFACWNLAAMRILLDIDHGEAAENMRSWSGCLNRVSASIGGASARIRLLSGLATG